MSSIIDVSKLVSTFRQQMKSGHVFFVVYLVEVLVSGIYPTDKHLCESFQSVKCMQ